VENDFEKLANLRAKKRVGSWSEQFKSIWGNLLGLLCVLGFFALLVLWIGVSNGEISVGLAALITVLIGILGWFFYRRHKAWEKEQFHKFYEEELLELKLKK